MNKSICDQASIRRREIVNELGGRNKCQRLPRDSMLWRYYVSQNSKATEETAVVEEG
jgi:hypothetical protein